jgi:hypothetical protein
MSLKNKNTAFQLVSLIEPVVMMIVLSIPWKRRRLEIREGVKPSGTKKKEHDNRVSKVGRLKVGPIPDVK